MNYTTADLLKLYSDSEFYDTEFANRSNDTHFFRSVCKGDHGKVLEIACGSGRITHEVSKVVSEIEGKDISPEMIALAMKKFPDIPFRVENMVETKGSYDLIYCATNAFQHILSEGEALKALISVHAALTNKGEFVLDIQNPNLEKLSRDRSVPYKQKTFSLNGEKVDAYLKGEYHIDSQIYYFNISYRISCKEVKTKSVAMKMFTHQTILELIKKAGFNIKECWGDYDFSSFNSQSPKQIFILQK